MKKRDKRVIILLIVWSLFCNMNLSARKNPHEIAFFGGGGVSFYGYKAPMNSVFSIGYNMDIGLGFTGFVSKQCGFHIGARYGLFNVRAHVGDLFNFTPGLIDIHSYPYDLYTTLSGYSEIHKMMFLEFPLLFQFQTKQMQTRHGNKDFYTMTGAKLLVLFNRTYDAQITTLYNAAYYPEFDNWTATQTFVGLGEFVGKDADGKFGVALLPMFTLESGIKWRIGNKCFLYTGTYFDCGLNDPGKKNRKPVSNYTAVERLADLTLLEFYSNSYLMNVGIKLRLTFHTSKNPSHKTLKSLGSAKSSGSLPCSYLPQKVKRRK